MCINPSWQKTLSELKTTPRADLIQRTTHTHNPRRAKLRGPSKAECEAIKEPRREYS